MMKMSFLHKGSQKSVFFSELKIIKKGGKKKERMRVDDEPHVDYKRKKKEIPFFFFFFIFFIFVMNHLVNEDDLISSKII